MRFEELSSHILERIQGATLSTSAGLLVYDPISEEEVVSKIATGSNIMETRSGIFVEQMNKYLTPNLTDKLFAGSPITGVIHLPSTLKLGLMQSSGRKHILILPIRYHSFLVGMIVLFRDVAYHEIPDLSRFYQVISQLSIRLNSIVVDHLSNESTRMCAQS